MGEIESALDLILKNQAGAVQNLSAKATEDTDGEAVPSPAPRPPRSDRISPETAEAIWKAMAQQMDQERQERQKLLEWFSAEMDQMRKEGAEKDLQIQNLAHENSELKKQLAIQQTASEVLSRIFGTGRLYDIRGHPDGDSAYPIRQRIFDKEEKVKDENGNETTRKVILTHPKVSYFRVFNAQQVEDFPSFSPPPPYTKTELETVINHVIDTSECPIRELAQERAFYSPSADEIILPIRSSFKDEVSFAKTLIHEMAHSTGHPTRLNRPMGGAFGSPAYAREELRAEIGALFTEADLGIRLTEENYEDHSDYLKSWIGALKDDYNEFFHACSDAEKICGRIVSNYTRKYELTRVPDAVPEYAPQLEKGIVSENETSPEKKIVPESETNPERVATSDHGIETEKKPGTRPRRKEKTL